MHYLGIPIYSSTAILRLSMMNGRFHFHATGSQRRLHAGLHILIEAQTVLDVTTKSISP